MQAHFVKCPLHSVEAIMVCLNPECHTKRHACLTCIDQAHKRHDLVTLKFIDEQIVNIRQKEDESIKQHVAATIQELKKNIIHKVMTVKKNIEASIEKLLFNLSTLCDEALDITYTNSNEKINAISSFKEDSNRFVNQIIKLMHQKQLKLLSSPEEASLTVKRIMERINLEMNQFETNFEPLTANFERCYSFTKSSLFAKTSQFSSHTFNKNFKSNFIQLLNDDRTIRRVEGSSLYPVALVSSPVTPNNCQFTFRIDEWAGQKGMWLGVCILEKAKALNFASCYGIGKGSYAIDQVSKTQAIAFSWSHHNQTFNSKPVVGFQFGEGSIIKVSVNLVKGSVSFTHQQKTFEQPIEANGAELYAFAGVTNLNDQISLL